MTRLKIRRPDTDRLDQIACPSRAIGDAVRDAWHGGNKRSYFRSSVDATASVKPNGSADVTTKASAGFKLVQLGDQLSDVHRGP